MTTVACRWAKAPRPPTDADAALQPKSTLKDIMSEQVAHQLASEGMGEAPSAPKSVYHRSPAEEEDDALRLALELSAREAEAMGIVGSDAGSHEDSSTATTDLALAVALAEEEARAARSGAQLRAGYKVAMVSRAEVQARDAVAARQRPTRQLLSAADAPEEVAPGTLSSIAGIPVAHLNHHDAQLLTELAEEEDEKDLLQSLRGRGVRGRYRLGVVEEEGGEPMLTKHDAELHGRHTARQLAKVLGPAAGDTSSFVIPQTAVVGLKRHMQKQTVKGTSARGRVEEETFATDNEVWNARTRLALMKLINSGRLERVAGVCKVGKEASVYLGLGWNAAVHAELSRDGASGQRSLVWEDGATEEAVEDDETDAVEAEGEEEGDPEPRASGSVPDVRSAPDRADRRVDLDTHLSAGSVAEDGVRSDDVAVKIFKLSLAEFKDRRMYMDGDRRYAHTKLKHQNARKLIPLWAEKEFKNLVRIHRAGIPSPAPLLLRDHIMVMSFIGADGWPAPQLREAPIKSVKEWSRVYRQVVAIMSALYKWTHLVHADLSEYNLLYWDRAVYVIDVGQAVDTSHPLSADFLRSDVRNITKFFAKKGVDVLSEEALFALVTDFRLAPRPACGARTGAHDTHAPAVGSGLRPLEHAIERARVAAQAAYTNEATSVAPFPVASPREDDDSDPEESEDEDFDGDYFDGQDNPIAAAVDALLVEESG